jgi:uncharacterized protein (DUF362 family)/ferredoxin
LRSYKFLLPRYDRKVTVVRGFSISEYTLIPKIDIIRCNSPQEIRERLFPALDSYRYLLPVSKRAQILLKPNLNSNMNALTGNTTDLRILSCVIRFLKDEGYTNIVIGEGTNSGFYRSKIGVITRLGVDALAKHYGVKVKDLNYSESYEIDFNGGIKASVAKECREAALFINLPKVKTHFENGMSVCLKNLMGCLVGQENKKKTHQYLAENILKINQQVKPHLHIVDGLIAMEGLGPSRGIPIRMDTMIVGRDPYLIDLVCAHLASFNHRDIRTLDLADKKGLLTSEHHAYVETLNLEKIKKKFLPPKAGPLATFIHSPKRQQFFLKIRNTKLFSYLASTDWFGNLLFLTGLRQDVFLQQEMRCDALEFDKTQCSQCKICQDLCPMGLELPGAFEKMDDTCIHCLYCFSACPENAIRFKGELGFFEEQLKQYDDTIRKLYL